MKNSCFRYLRRKVWYFSNNKRRLTKPQRRVARNFAQELFTLSVGSCYKVSKNKRQKPRLSIFRADNITMLLISFLVLLKVLG